MIHPQIEEASFKDSAGSYFIHPVDSFESTSRVGAGFGAKVETFPLSDLGRKL